MEKRVPTFLMAGLLLFASSCGEPAPSGNADTTADGSAETTAPTVRANLPEGLDFGGKVFHCAAYQPGTGEWYYYADSQNGDVMNDALYRRTRAVEEELNVKITFDWYKGGGSYKDEMIDLVKEQVLAGDSGIDQVMTHSINGIASMSSSGYLMDLDDLPYIDRTADWWNAEQMENLKFGDKTFFAVNDFMLPSPYLIYFNRQMIADLKLDDPYQLVYDGKWTLEAFAKLAESVKADLNGDGKMSYQDDRWGVSCWEASKYISFMPGADVFITGRGADGKMIVDMNVEKAQKICEVLSDLTNREVNYLGQQKDTATHLLLDSGRVLFYLDSISNITNLRDCPVDFGLLPYPKYDENQENYRSLDWGGLMCVPVGSNTEITAAVMELEAFLSREDVIPTYYNVLLGEKLARDDDARKMLELVSDTLCYDVGGTYFGQTAGFKDLFYTASTLAVEKKSADFASWYASKKTTAEQTIADYYKALDSLK